MNFNNLIVLASAAGVPLGLIKYISIWEKERNWKEISLVVGQLNTLLLILGVIIVFFNILFAKDISIFLFNDESYYFFIILISLSIPLALVNLIFEAILKGMKKFGHYVKISIVIAVLTLAISILFVILFKIEGAVYSVLISTIIISIVYGIYFHNSKILKLDEFFSLNFKYSSNFRKVINLGLASLIVGSADQLSQLLIRAEIIKSLGINSNGLYQSIYAISLNYFSILFMSLGIYLLPVLSEIKENDLVNAEINSTLKLSLIFIVPLISIIFTFREQIIILLYSKEFLPSTDLLFFNFLGDYFKAFSWIIGAWLIPLGKIKAWVSFSIVYYINFIVIFIVLLFYFDLGLKSVVISYFISYVIHTIINIYYIKKYNKFRFISKNLILIPISICFILGLLITSKYNQLLGYILILPSVLLWFKLSVSKIEMIKAFGLIKEKIYKS